MLKQTAYGKTAKVLHWLIAALLAVQFPIGWLMPDIRRGMAPGNAMKLHIVIGLVILTLIVLRVVWRRFHPVAPADALPPWQRLTSASVHWLLNGLVFATALRLVLCLVPGLAITAVFRSAPACADRSRIGRRPPGRRLASSSRMGPALRHGLHVMAAFMHAFIFRDRVVQRLLAG